MGVAGWGRERSVGRVVELVDGGDELSVEGGGDGGMPVMGEAGGED